MAISWKDSLHLPLSAERLEACLQQFLEVLGCADRQISLYCTDDAEIQNLNHQYRQQNKPTDVLSWSYGEPEVEGELLGEIVISLDRVKIQAQTHQFSEEVELLRLLAHGCAHLAGYDHERSEEEAQAMLEVEIEMLKKVGLAQIYP